MKKVTLKVLSSLHLKVENRALLSPKGEEHKDHSSYFISLKMNVSWREIQSRGWSFSCSF